jgi:hypothetical protein
MAKGRQSWFARLYSRHPMPASDTDRWRRLLAEKRYFNALDALESVLERSPDDDQVHLCWDFLA